MVPWHDARFMPSLRRNPALLCAFHGLQMSLFPMAVITLFYQQEIGMTMTQIFLLQGCFGLGMVLFEFPSGYLADRIGYRRSLAIAALMMVTGWAFYVQARSLVAVVVAELILGIAMSLISGTDSALMYESLLETDRELEYAVWAGRMRFWGQLSEGLAALAAGLLYALSHRLPFAMEIGVWLVAGAVALSLREPARHRPPLTDNLRQIRTLFRHVFVENRPLRAVLFVTIALGMSSFIPVWSIQIYASDAGLPAAWLGPMWSVANIIVAVGSLYSHRARRAVGLQRLLLACSALITIGFVGLGLTHAVWGFAFYFCLTTMRGLFGPVLNHEEQRLIGSRDRAGLLSIRSFVFRAIFCVLGPAVGWSMDRWGQHSVYLVLGAVLGLLTLLGTLWLNRVGVRDEPKS